ncbi:hypothetical protein ACLOJK_030365 [Asimina triloba]
MRIWSTILWCSIFPKELSWHPPSATVRSAYLSCSKHGDDEMIPTSPLTVVSSHLYAVQAMAPIQHLFFFNGADNLKIMAALVCAARSCHSEADNIIVSCNSAIARNSHQNPQDALCRFKQQLRLLPSFRPDAYTFPPLLKGCAALRSLFIAQQLHSHVARCGMLSDPFTAAALVDAYGKCWSPQDALKVFNEMPQRIVDAVSWTALISSFSANGLVNQAVQTFAHMRHTDDCVDAVTVAAVLSALDPEVLGSTENCLFYGQMIHSVVAKCGFGLNIRLANTLVHMYSRCGAVHAASAVFEEIPFKQRDVVSWNTLISGFVLNEGNAGRAVSMFHDMVAAAVIPNRVTLIALFKSCADFGHIETCRWVYSNDVTVSTALLDMHAKCGNLELAKQIFDAIHGKNVVCWSAMIAGYGQSSSPEEALRLFQQMLLVVRPNAITMVSVVAACSELGISRVGKVVHKFVIATGLENYSRVASALIDMYAKCGDIKLAQKVFYNIDDTYKSMVSWSAIIGAEGLHGEGRQALCLFEEMQLSGFAPNAVTFVSLLSACSHAGLVDEGKSYFRSMWKDYGVAPNTKHYTCMVDILGRAGCLHEAHDLIISMPVEADLAIWGSLLGACRLHGNWVLGQIVEEQLLKLEPCNVGHHVLLANIYSEAERWEDVVRIRMGLRKSGLRKIAGRSLVEIGNDVHGFTAEDWSHPESKLIYKVLHALDDQVMQAGITKDEFDELMRSRYHSERLAIAFAILRNLSSTKEELKAPGLDELSAFDSQNGTRCSNAEGRPYNWLMQMFWLEELKATGLDELSGSVNSKMGQ